MSSKNLIFLINCHTPYIRHKIQDGEVLAQNDVLFSSINNTYLPLLKMFGNLKNENIKFKIAMVLSPVLCSLLEDEEIQNQYLCFLDRSIALGEAELERTKDNPELNAVVRREYEKNVNNKKAFVEKFGKRLVPAFLSLSNEGYIELLGTCGTYAFLPHLKDNEESVNAQIESGLISHKYFFGKAPSGFFLPENGYFPGLEKNLRSYGIDYSILSSQSVLFSDLPPQNGIFTPCRTSNAVGIFTENSSFASFIDEIKENSVYKDVSSDIGFELPLENLRCVLDYGVPRFALGYKYWENSGNDKKILYSFEKALAQVNKDALSFLDSQKSVLSEAEKNIKSEKICSVCQIESKILGCEWEEGVAWLESVLRENAKSENPLEITSFSDNLDDVFKLQRVTPVEASVNGMGYGEDLLESSNDFMMRYVKKASDRMTDIAERFPSEASLKGRLLNLGAKEVLLAQSCEWAEMLNKKHHSEYVRNQFTYFIVSFTKVFDALGSKQVSSEWLTKLENEHTLFPWMNFRIFMKKK